jgi:PPOX class probable FMN-dependent enzyme
MDTRFSAVITTEAALRRSVGHPIPRIAAKARNTLDANARSFIAASPFVVVASCDSRGNLDVSPKGDAPGFVRVLDDSTLAMPDRAGNRRADTFMNVIQVPRVALLFVVPGQPYTLRAAGDAMIVRDEWLLGEMAGSGKPPTLALVVQLDEVFFHCPKCIVRSSLWKHENWRDATELASFEDIKSDSTLLQEATCTRE